MGPKKKDRLPGRQRKQQPWLLTALLRPGCTASASVLRATRVDAASQQDDSSTSAGGGTLLLAGTLKAKKTPVSPKSIFYLTV